MSNTKARVRFAAVLTTLATVLALAATTMSLTACSCADPMGNPVDC